MDMMTKLGSFLKRKPRHSSILEQHLTLVRKEPGNAKAHLKLAEIYQREGEKHKAIAEYLLAAEIFSKSNFYARAMAIYKQVVKQDPNLDQVSLKIAEIYHKMGFLGDAFAQYRSLAHQYDRSGKKEKALEVMGRMAELDPRKTVLKEKIQKLKSLSATENGGAEESGESRGAEQHFFDLGAELELEETSGLEDFKEISTMEKMYGFEEIFKELKERGAPSLVDPNFNYNMGVACREMGFYEDATDQFQVAWSLGQNPFEAAKMMGLCYKERDMLEEARESLTKALEVKGVPAEKILEVKYELGLICRQLGRTEDALDLLREISIRGEEPAEKRRVNAGLPGSRGRTRATGNV